MPLRRHLFLWEILVCSRSSVAKKVSLSLCACFFCVSGPGMFSEKLEKSQPKPKQTWPNALLFILVTFPSAIHA